MKLITVKEPIFANESNPHGTAGCAMVTAVLLCAFGIVGLGYKWPSGTCIMLVVFAAIFFGVAISNSKKEAHNYFLSKRNTYHYTYSKYFANQEDTSPSGKETTYIPIERETYDDWLYRAEKLNTFLQVLRTDQEFLDILSKQYNVTDADLDSDDKFLLIAIYDIYMCIDGLGYYAEGESCEAILFYGMTKMIVSGEAVPPAKDTLLEETGHLIKSALQLKGQLPNDYYFALSRTLAVYDKDKFDCYQTLLYEFAHGMAKADGGVSSMEMKFLNRIKAPDSQAKENAGSTAAKVYAKPEEEDCKQTSEADTARKDKAPDNQQANGKPKKKQKPRAVKELDALVGLASVKKDITKLSNFIRINTIRKEHGLAGSSISYHCVFTGNPGTGKTTVARIIAGIYRELGVLSKGHLVETDRSGLVAEYVGQTAVKTNKVIDSALDGILFIDEAYSLATGGTNDYGLEAIATLLKRMEDDRDRLVVILAGYGNEMNTFINSNPGLASRFNRYIHFPDYDAEELYEIFRRNVQKHEYRLSPEAEVKLKSLLADAVAHKDKNFGNARFVRNLFEKTLENQASRLSAVANLSKDALMMITAEDILPVT